MNGNCSSNPAEELVLLLKSRNLKISSAESCTGGLLAKLITDIPGSSDVFPGSVVAYSNEIKMSVLSVPEHILKQYGAVSQETAISLAVNIKTVMKSDIGVGISGIAGPGGGTPEKRTGTVCFGFSFPDGNFSVTKIFDGTRARVRMASAIFAADYCIEHIKGIQ